MSNIIKILSFIRWRTKAIRKITKLFYSFSRNSLQTTNPDSQLESKNLILETLKKEAFVKIKQKNTPNIDIRLLKGIQGKQAFVDVGEKYWPDLKSVVLDILDNTLVSDAVLKYFNKKPWLWNISLNYSEPKNEITGSQLWHFDYGDTKQLHIMIYFNDVDIETGPFTFLNKKLSSSIKRSKFFIERLTDKDLLDTYSIEAQDSAIRLTGCKGDVFISDPGLLLHQGARCKKPRLVAFLTITSSTPMSLNKANGLSPEYREELLNAYKKGKNNKVFDDGFFV